MKEENKKTQSVAEFIFELDAMTTKEFCDKFNYAPPSWKGDVSLAAMEFAYIDSVKWRMVKEFAKQSQQSYSEQEVKLIATRFARESRLKQDITSNDTIKTFEAWFKPVNFNHQ